MDEKKCEELTQDKWGRWVQQTEEGPLRYASIEEYEQYLKQLADEKKEEKAPEVEEEE